MKLIITMDECTNMMRYILVDLTKLHERSGFKLLMVGIGTGI